MIQPFSAKRTVKGSIVNVLGREMEFLGIGPDYLEDGLLDYKKGMLPKYAWPHLSENEIHFLRTGHSLTDLEHNLRRAGEEMLDMAEHDPDLHGNL